MSGQPAARLGDAVAYGVIVQGSATVLIGSQSGKACSVCPGGMAIGSPVNPALGAKVLVGPQDLDFSLPGPLPIIWQRRYSSYINLEHGARCGLLGYGWTLPLEIHAELDESACRLFDTGGRSIDFAALAPGRADYSPSENLWLLRGGPESGGVRGELPWQRQARWRHLPEQWRREPGCLIVAGSDRVAWGFGNARGQRFDPYQLIDPLGRRQNFLRDDAGRLTGLIDGYGRHYQFRIQALHPPREACGAWQADSGLRLTGVDLTHDPLFPDHGPIPLIRYQYSAEGDLIGVIDRGGALVREFAYVEHRLVWHRNRGGPEHRYRYESAAPGARVVEQINQDGLSYRFDYRDADNSVLVVDGLGRQNLYRFEGEAGLKRLHEHRRPDGSTVGYRYDGAGRLTAQIDPLGRTTRRRYDREGRLLAETGPDGGQSEQRWDEARHLLLETRTPAGAITRYDYDEYGRLTELTRADGGTTHYRYPDPGQFPLVAGQPNEIIDARGGVKKLLWSPAGRLLAFTDCSGRTSRYRYDRWGGLTQTGDPLGQITRQERDARGRVVMLILADGSRHGYAYDERGNVIEYRDPGGNCTRYQYDRWDRLIRRTGNGESITLEYDLAGRLTALTNENRVPTHFDYDALDRPIREIGIDGRTRHYRYDSAGQLLEIQDGNAGENRSQHFRYDLAGRLSERRLAATDTAPAEIHRFTYDRDGALLTAAVYPESPTTAASREPAKQSEVRIERDPAGRAARETQVLYRDGEIEFAYCQTHAYDPLGQRQHSVLPDLGELAWLSYGSGHIHGLTLNRQPLLDFERDHSHREIERHCANGLIEHRQLDPLGRLLGQHLAATGNPPTQDRRYRYDALGRIEQTDADGQATAYRYDPLGRLVGMLGDDGERRWRFDPAGNRLPEPPPDQGTAIAESWRERVRANLPNPEFNALGQDAGQREPGATEIGQWRHNRIGHHAGTRYRYDVWGNRIEAERPDGSKQHYRYDGLHRLSEVENISNDGRSIGYGRYRYDALGRRLAKTVLTDDGQSRTVWYGWDGDRQVRIEDERTARQIIYERDNFMPLLELIRARAEDGAIAALLADAAADDAAEPPAELMRAMLKQLPGDTHRHLEDTLRSAVATGLPAVTKRAMPPSFDTAGTERLLAETRQRLAHTEAQRTVAMRFYHCDHLGTPIALSDEQGRIVWKARYDPWGQQLEEYNPQGLEQPLRFQGQFFDPESGLHYNRHRYYDPALGAYITQDPLGLAGGINLSLYSVTPLHEIDPLGLQAAPAQAAPQANNQQTCTYHQGTGNLTCTNAQGQQTVNHDGYAGRGDGRNNPDMQNVANTGPVPRGNYTIGPSIRHNTAGPATHRLTPDAGNNMENRAGFLIHGDNATNDASEGCIIMPRTVRDSLREGDRLEVVR